MLILQPSAFPKNLQASTVHDKVNWTILLMPGRHRQGQPCATAGKGRVVRHKNIQPHKSDKAPHKPFSLAQRLLVNHPKRETDRDRQIGISWLATPRLAPLCAPSCLHVGTQPNRHIPAPSQAFGVVGPVRYAIPLLLKLMPTRSVELMRHQERPIGQGSKSLAEPIVSAQQRRSLYVLVNHLATKRPQTV